MYVSVCVCDRKRERVHMCVSAQENKVRVCVWKREREKKYTCVRERESTRVYVCVFVFVFPVS